MERGGNPFLFRVLGLSLTFLLPGIAKYHGDERFYTDAAIRMSQTGDYFTPYAANGALRFAKPIAPYWAVLAGYSVLGINLTASRIAFLIAGCLVILFTYRLSLSCLIVPGSMLRADRRVNGSSDDSRSLDPRRTACLFVLLSLLVFARIFFKRIVLMIMPWSVGGMAVKRADCLRGVALFRCCSAF